MSAAQAGIFQREAYPSGFTRAGPCEDLLRLNSNEFRRPFAKFRALSPAEKIRILHGLAEGVKIAPRWHVSEMQTIGRRAQALGAVPVADLAPFAEELLLIAYKLAPLAGNAVGPDAESFRVFLKTVVALPLKNPDRELRRLRSNAHTTLGLVFISQMREASGRKKLELAIKAVDEIRLAAHESVFNGELIDTYGVDSSMRLLLAAVDTFDTFAEFDQAAVKEEIIPTLTEAAFGSLELYLGHLPASALLPLAGVLSLPNVQRFPVITERAQKFDELYRARENGRTLH